MYSLLPHPLCFVAVGRITSDTLAAALNELCGDVSEESHGRYGRVQTYVCGPPDMIEAVEQDLLSLGLHSDQIHYEKWW